MISFHSIDKSLMDWEPAEGYGMDVDENGVAETPYFPKHMAPTPIQEVHMTSPIFVAISQPPLPVIETNCSTFLLPPFELNTKPLVFPPFKFPPAPRQALREHPIVPLDFSSAYMPAILAYRAESPTPERASSQANNYGLHYPVTSQNAEIAPLNIFDVNVPVVPCDVPLIPGHQPGYLAISSSKTRVIDHDSHPLPSNHDCCPTRAVTPSPSKSRTNSRDFSPVLVPAYSPKPLPDILDERLLSDMRALSIKSPISVEWPDRTVDNDIIASRDGELFYECVTPPGWPGWIIEQAVTLGTPRPVIAKSNTPSGWSDSDCIVDNDTTPMSQYPILETTPLHCPQTTISQEYINSGTDLIGLSSPSSNSPSSSQDDYILRAFGGSSLEDLDWILEGFRATNVPDAYMAFKNVSDASDAINHGLEFIPLPLSDFSLIPPYDWALVSEAGPDLMSFDLAHNPRHGSVETSLVLATTQSSSFDIVQSGPFQTSTPAPCDRPIFGEPLPTAMPLGSMASFSTSEVVITARDSQSSISCSPISHVLNTSGLQSPFNSICHQGTSNALVSFSKAAYTMERSALRNMKTFKKKLSCKIQKLRARTKTSGLLQCLVSASQSIRVGQQNDIDIEHDVFGKIAEVADKMLTRSTKVDASTQTDEIAAVAYNLRPPRRYSPYARYSPYRRSGRDFTFHPSGSVDLEDAQLIPNHEESHCIVTSETSYVLPSPEDSDFLGCNIQGSISSERDLEAGLAVRANLKEFEEVNWKMTVPGAYPIEEAVYALDEPSELPHIHEIVQEKDFYQEKISFPGAYPYALAETSELPAKHSVEVAQKEDSDQKKLIFPGAYPIEEVVYELDESSELAAKHLVEAAQKKGFEAKVLPIKQSTKYGLKESFFKFITYLFDW